MTGAVLSVHKIEYCIRKQGETESAGVSMSFIRPQTVNSGAITPMNGSDSRMRYRAAP